MPITVKDRNGNLRVEHVGRVARVEKLMERRNVSDTLDYSDYQTIQSVYALVYRGRVAEERFYANTRFFEAGQELPLEHRFSREDCSNVFVWRGADHRTPEADRRDSWSTEMEEDFVAWTALQEERVRSLAERRAKEEKEAKARKEEEERNRPVVGKAMVVFKGRKVKPGAVGTVAYIHSSGSVLLKADNEWQDRKANGVWVNPTNLKAR